MLPKGGCFSSSFFDIHIGYSLNLFTVYLSIFPLVPKEVLREDSRDHRKQSATRLAVIFVNHSFSIGVIATQPLIRVIPAHNTAVGA